ncbi:MAG: phosphatidate cytidylyltransferase [Pseudomonadota bacterium]|nr:phosphatidate cytidylyltransferase [Pseudomonadota bacterium]
MSVSNTKFKDLPVRALTAFVLISLVLVCIFLGEFTSVVLLVVCSSVLLFEVISVSFRNKFSLNLSNMFAILSFSIFPVFQFFNIFPFSILVLAGVTNILIFGWNFFRLFHILYFGLSIFCFQKILFGDGTMISILGLKYIICLVIASDIGGYIFGRLLAGPKLFPSISPKKTWAGALGGVLLAISIAPMLASKFQYSIFGIILITAILAVVSQVGDIFQSYFKRQFKVKDSGSILPGHGGLYDRLDGLLAVVPVYYFVSLYHTYF